LVTVIGDPPDAVLVNTKFPFLEAEHSNDHDTVHAAGRTTEPSALSPVPDRERSCGAGTVTVLDGVATAPDVARVVLDEVVVGAADDEAPHAAAPAAITANTTAVAITLDVGRRRAVAARPADANPVAFTRAVFSGRCPRVHSWSAQRTIPGTTNPHSDTQPTSLFQ